MERLQLTELHLMGNLLTFISGLEFLPQLRLLDLCRNQLKQ